MVLQRAARSRGPALPSEPAAHEIAVGGVGDSGRAGCASSRRDDAAVCLAGPERLRLLEKLLPFTRVLRVYGPAPTRDRAAEPGAWELELDGARLVFGLSPELFRGFSGEGGVLADLAGADETVVEEVAETLHGEPRDRCRRGFARRGDRALGRTTALGALGAAGRSRLRPRAERVLPPRVTVRPRRTREDAPRASCARAVRAGCSAAGRRRERGRAKRRRRVPRPRRAGLHALHVCLVREAPRERGPCKHVLAVEHARRVARVA